MKPPRPLFPLASFAAGAALVLIWNSGSDNPAPEGGAAEIFKAPPATAAILPEPEITLEMLAFAGLSRAPSLEDVLNSSGLEQTVRAGLFARKASSAALLDRLEDAGIEDRELSDSLWRRWMKIDPAAAMKRGAERGGSAWEQAWNARAALDPRGALAASDEDANARTTALRALSKDDPEAALRFLRERPEERSKERWEDVIAGIGVKDPAAAAALALERHIALAETVRSWALRDPERALAWARGIPPGSEMASERRRAVEFAVSGLIAVDPAAGLMAAEALEPGKGRSERLAEAVEALAAKDPEAARTAAEALPAEEDRGAALSALAAGLAGHDPAAALDVQASLNFPWRRDTLIQLMNSLPRETMETLAALPRDQPPTSKRPSLLHSMSRFWAGRQPEEASAWVKNLPTGPKRDDAVSGLVEFMIRDDPLPDWEAALAWGESAPGVSENLWTSTMRMWRGRDDPAARAYLDTLPLTEEERSKIDSETRPSRFE